MMVVEQVQVVKNDDDMTSLGCLLWLDYLLLANLKIKIRRCLDSRCLRSNFCINGY